MRKNELCCINFEFPLQVNLREIQILGVTARTLLPTLSTLFFREQPSWQPLPQCISLPAWMGGKLGHSLNSRPTPLWLDSWISAHQLTSYFRPASDPVKPLSTSSETKRHQNIATQSMMTDQ